MRFARLIFTLLLALTSVAAYAQGSQFQSVATTIGTVNGTQVMKPVTSGFVSICLVQSSGSCPTAAIYTDATLTTPAANPILLDKYGNFQFWAAPGSYKYSICSAPTSCNTFTTYISNIGPAGCLAGSTCSSLSVNNVPLTAGNTTLISASADPLRYISGSNSTTQALALSAIASLRGNFTDGNAFWKAGANYNAAFPADNYIAMEAQPNMFTSSQINALARKFVATSQANSCPNAGMAFVLGLDSSTATCYSGWDQLHHHATAEPELFVPLMYLLAYQKNGDISQFAADAAQLDIAMNSLQIDSGTGLMRVVAGDDYVPFGFMEMARLRGNVLTGSVMLWRSYKALASLNAAAGRGLQAASYSQKADMIRSSLTTSSPLWNASAGIFNADTTLNTQPDVIGSSLAVYAGLVNGAQAQSISQWLSSNYNTIQHLGFFRESNADWNSYGYISNTGTIIPGPFGAGQYQNGYWAVANTYILSTLRAASLISIQAVTNWVLAPPPVRTAEWLNIGDDTPQGSTVQLVTPMGFAWYSERYAAEMGDVSGTKAGYSWSGAAAFSAGRHTIAFDIGFNHTPSCRVITANGAAPASSVAFTGSFLTFVLPEVAYATWECVPLPTADTASPVGPQSTTASVPNGTGYVTIPVPSPGYRIDTTETATAQRMVGSSVLSNWVGSGNAASGTHTITFTPAFQGTPSCTIQSANGAAQPTGVQYTGGSGGSLQFTVGATTYVSYQCIEVSNNANIP